MFFLEFPDDSFPYIENATRPVFVLFFQLKEDIAKLKFVPSLDGSIYQLKKDKIEVRFLSVLQSWLFDRHSLAELTTQLLKFEFCS